MLLKKTLILIVSLIFNSWAQATQQNVDDWLLDNTQLSNPVMAKNAMVTSQDAYASQAGLRILKQGGNAVDAAVATAFTLAVTLPRAGNIAGDGFMLIWLNKEKKGLVIDFRSVAPLAVKPALFLDEKGEVDIPKPRDSIFSSVV